MSGLPQSLEQVPESGGGPLNPPLIWLLLKMPPLPPFHVTETPGQAAEAAHHHAAEAAAPAFGKMLQIDDPSRPRRSHTEIGNKNLDYVLAVLRKRRP